MIDLTQYIRLPISHGKSRATVERLARADGSACYLKTTPIDLGFALHAEKLRYEWLRGRAACPDVLAYDVIGDEEHLVLAEVPGLPSFDASLPRDTVIDRLAEGLRFIHSIPLAECPFDMRLDVKIAMAKDNAKSGRVDLDDLQPEHNGWTTAMLLREVERLRPQSEDLVVAHGDYCLPNVMLSDDAARITGFIDIGYLGVADRYQDLALAWQSIRYNFGEEYVTPFFSAYGLPDPDFEKIAFYNLLDELF